MEYDAINLDGSSRTCGHEYLMDIIRSLPVSFISLNLRDAATGEHLDTPFVIRDTGTHRVALLGLTSVNYGHEAQKNSADAPDAYLKVLDPEKELRACLPEVKKKAELVVVVSTLSQKENEHLASEVGGIDLIVGNNKGGGTKRTANTLIVNNETSEGKYVGLLGVQLDSGGRIDDYRLRWIALGKSFDEDPEMREILEQFYQKVADEPALQSAPEPKFRRYALEEEAANEYVGAAKCGECHAEIFDGWRKSKHANAFLSLVKRNRHFYSDCVSCHTTGAGYASGFAIDQSAEHLQGVQCEVCHGPGSRHSVEEDRLKLRAEVPKDLCMECHTPDSSPDFLGHYVEFLAKVDHSNILSAHESDASEAPKFSRIASLKKSDAPLYAKLEKELFCTCCKSHALLHCNCGNARRMKKYLNDLLLTHQKYSSIVSEMIATFGPKTVRQEKQ